jgi:CRP/FNR family transcriptional regulator, cyclic AMP receptor protein
LTCTLAASLTSGQATRGQDTAQDRAVLLGPTRGTIDFLSLLSAPNRARLLENSTRSAYRAGSIVLQPEGPAHSYVIERGLARLYWTVPDGRQTTTAFLYPTELVGGVTLLGHSPVMFMQALTETTLISLDVQAVRELAATEIEVATAISNHFGMRARAAYGLVAIRTLGTIRERVAYDLLNRASQSQLVVGRLEVNATQADLADSIGSSREVVGRALRELRLLGIVETAPAVVRVLDPARLADSVMAFVI